MGKGELTRESGSKRRDLVSGGSGIGRVSNWDNEQNLEPCESPLTGQLMCLKASKRALLSGLVVPAF